MLRVSIQADSTPSKDIFEKLLEKDFNVMYRTDDGYYLLFSLIKRGYINANNIESIFSCSDMDWNICDEKGKTLLMYTIELQSISLAKKIIDSGVNVHDRDETGNSAIMHASFYGLQIFNILVDAGANIFDRDNGNITTLMQAARGESLEVVKTIIEMKVDVNSLNNEHQSALMYAICSKKEDISQLLINSNANIHHKNGRGESILMHAIYNGLVDLSEELIHLGANMLDENNHGESVLVYAIDSRKSDFVITLIKNKVDVNLKYGGNMIPLMRSRMPEIT